MTKEVSRLTNLIRKFRHHYSLYIVRKLWVHWFNPFYTLYFNLIFLPLKQAICFPVFIYGWPRLYAQMGHIKCIDECYPGMVRINLSFPGGPQCSAGNTELTIWGTIIFHGKCVVGSGNKIIIGGVLAVGVIFYLTDGGPSAIMDIAMRDHKIDFGPYAWDFTQLTFVVMVFNGVFYALQKYGTDQSIVQRYLTARSDKEAKKASYLGILLSVPTWALFMFVGTCLYAFYQINAGELPVGIKSDEVFPHFIATEMPVGITGLIIAALIAGAISSLDADVNCISAVVVEDYYARFRPKATDKQRLLVGRIAVVVVGIGAILIAMLYVSWGGEGVLGTLFGLYAIISAGIVGIFMLGLFSRRANWQGLYIGIAATILFTAYAVLTTTKFGSGPDAELILDLGDWNFKHHTYMLGVYSHVIVLVVGYVASLFFKTPLADKELTIYGYLEEKKKRSQV